MGELLEGVTDIDQRWTGSPSAPLPLTPNKNLRPPIRRPVLEYEHA